MMYYTDDGTHYNQTVIMWNLSSMAIPMTCKSGLDSKLGKIY
jgi:hypothetical protein